ncbi:formimidoylglutamate deiminase [Colwellia sp. MB02u-18]|uniref:formimidoylglutamate deiminase n=1 Tax=unclassified Colwellia TaxID=196834 RepID=UPI0015F7011A|nr:MULTISPECIES: formimidoylglutamate deiminase [unclassified Colwellia]MBA6225612.1 formimidoylglutamate deiminase [Colwellia sp. MB3u-45]MBA6266860.1 formimidoylglutamate deiminase [Colwellia sp. MB3u-43]MBA6321772.1 formimidoylglutamate deiminase [Colwellia sp. MB02u-19]MBA6325002.1 formimidoylglutamate deiminase [Colwellia sp. MB02u-18]MBA6331367.1 formimidoylglutamate deiminase [Colwellia sp. MB02u-12]
MKLFAKKILLADGWANEQTLTIEQGVITDITAGYIAGAERANGVVIPGMVNCHSHAFQRAFAGFSEQGSEGQDSFWTWRNVMYKFLGQLSSEDIQVIARQLYIEMLKMGYTRVAEFHYLHHDIDGQNHQNLATMAQAIFAAAEKSGIGLTLLPVLYRFSGFGRQAATDGQKRFINSVEQFNDLVTDCFALAKSQANCNVGIAPHSLRAVDKNSLLVAVAHVRALDAQAPIHIHIAEQQKEVTDCLVHYGQRPVQWLLNNADLDQHWCLIHATHIDEQERKGIIASQAIAGICPTTEANLGDGIFPTSEFLIDNGTFAIGSDSHISVNPIEELRWLEYAQRLSKQQRALLANSEQKSVGLNLWQKAAAGGAQSTNSNTGALAMGKQADLLVLDDRQLRLFAHDDIHLLDSVIFASQSNPVLDVMVNGHWVIQGAEHVLEQASADSFATLLARLSA